MKTKITEYRKPSANWQGWVTIGYRIESAHIAQYSGRGSEVWFLDAIQENAEGRRSTSNICSGTKEYCITTRNSLLAR